MTCVAPIFFAASNRSGSKYLEPLRLDAAKKMGATHVINVREQDAGEEIKTITNGRGVDAAWETAGNPAALQSALASVRRGGKLAIVGLPSQNEIPLNVPFIADNEIDIYGIFRYANTYPKGIEFSFPTPRIRFHF